MKQLMGFIMQNILSHQWKILRKMNCFPVALGQLLVRIFILPDAPS